jgi:hypothetical protein
LSPSPETQQITTFCFGSNLAPESTMKAALLACCLLLYTPHVAAAKKLVVFAGPHETGGGDVNEFFATHTSTDQAGNSSALYGWTWPIIEDNEEGDIVASPHHLFDLLVEEQDNASIQSILISTIQKAFANSDNGVIIGSLLLDRVGVNPETSYDAVRALDTVVAALGISAEDVVVAITYRTPRIDQWASIFNNHFDFELYEDFLCSEEVHVKDRRWEWLDTCMNPFFVAQSYYDSGFEIVMIDQEGTANAGKDIAHVFACHITGGENCEDDWMNGLELDVVDLPPAIPINELGETRSSNLEQLFRLRDCHYMTQLYSQSRFQILYNEFTECHSKLTSYYEQFADTDFLMNAIQSQKNCQTSDIDVPSLLAQKDDLLINNPNKKLVIVAGPHDSQAEGAIKFFANYASTNEESTLSPSFNGWLWPNFETDFAAGTANHLIFDMLVAPTTDEIKAAILDGIQENFVAAEQGVILGSVLFDAVKNTPYSGYDAIAALQSVIDKLGIRKDHVAVVISYTTPRINHWGVAWDNHFDASTYEDFVCSDDQAHKRWEWLNSVMNPFQIAKSYFDEGYKVVVMDEKGIEDEGWDFSHAIACEILEGSICEDGYVSGLDQVVTDPAPSFDIEALSEQEQTDLEALFFGRDCYFANLLSGSHRFHILNDHGVWDACTSEMEFAYSALVETDYLINAIQAQQGCETFSVDIPSLVGRESDSNPEDDGSESGGGDGDEDGENGIDNDDDSDGTSNTNDESFEKKLVIFAGPHETAGGNVTMFLSRFAAPSSSEFSSSFDGWTWPAVDTESYGHTVPDYRVFDVMVKAEVDHDLQNFFIQTIKESWDIAEKGVVIGGLEFDKAGLNPYTGYDPLGLVRRLADALGIPENDVIIVIDYRIPRLDQWSAVWQNHFDGESYTYENFVCSSEENTKLKRWEYVDTVMNPMKVANAYADQGWSVAVIDYEGTNHVDRDVAHVIACEIMEGVDCEDGWVRDLKEERIPDPSSYVIEELQYTDRNELEQAFRSRDCSYRTNLENNPRFQVYHKRILWKSCPEEKESIFEQLKSTDLFVTLLQSQLSCGQSLMSISEFLSGVAYDTSSSGASDLGDLAIAVSVLAVLVTAMVFYLGMRRSRGIKRASHAPSDGVFRDGSLTSIGRDGPYRDDSDGQDPYRPYAVEYTIESVEGVPGHSFFKKNRKPLSRTSSSSGERVGPWRDDSDGKSRERAYSGDEIEIRGISPVATTIRSGNRSFPNEDIFSKLDRNESSEDSGFEV